jgi:hypothetical protein
VVGLILGVLKASSTIVESAMGGVLHRMTLQLTLVENRSRWMKREQ